MADALKAQQQDAAAAELSFHERLAMLVDQQWTWRENQALDRRMKAAKLRGSACIEEIDFRASRGLDRSTFRFACTDRFGAEQRGVQLLVIPAFRQRPFQFRLFGSGEVIVHRSQSD